jgi:hypothetical protein
LIKNQKFPCPQRSHPVDVIFDTVDDFLIGTVVVPGGMFARHGGADQAPSSWSNAICAESKPLALNQFPWILANSLHHDPKNPAMNYHFALI